MFVVRKNKGFTIVELTAVIVVISILVAISIVSYIGISSRAIQASVRTDLDNATKQIKQYQGTLGNGKYPGSVTDCPNPANGNICLKPSGSNKLSYKVYNTTKPKDFRITAYNEDQGIYYSNNASDIKCPLNFVIVPGSSLYNTKDFCVMKYEAKQASATVPVSKADNSPWANVAQEAAGLNNDATEYSKNVADCNNCHLISEAEWLTIAHDLLSVSSNWSDDVPGYNYIYRGNSAMGASSPISASKKDSEGYFGLNTSQGDGTLVATSITGDSQKRTLTLSNGEVIWDIAGNISEWTSSQADEGRPGKTGVVCNSADGSTFVEWRTADVVGTLNPNPSILFMTDIANYNTLTTSHGIGKLCSDPISDWSRAFVRGGSWVNGGISGVLSLSIYLSPGVENQYVGFRAAR